MHLQALKPDQPRSYSKGLPIRTAYLFPIARSLISSKREYPITLFHSQPALTTDAGGADVAPGRLCLVAGDEGSIKGGVDCGDDALTEER
jgi:hypothetical protein